MVIDYYENYLEYQRDYREKHKAELKEKRIKKRQENLDATRKYDRINKRVQRDMSLTEVERREKLALKQGVTLYIYPEEEERHKMLSWEQVKAIRYYKKNREKLLAYAAERRGEKAYKGPKVRLTQEEREARKEAKAKRMQEAWVNMTIGL